MTQEQFSKFRHEAVHELMRLNQECGEHFNLESLPKWNYDLERGTLVFSKDGVPQVTASIQVVGTTSKSASTWMWGWGNASLPWSAVELLTKVRDFGEREQIAELSTPLLPDDNYLGWEMTAIAASVIGAKGAYRCPGDDGFVYVIFLNISYVLQ